MAWIYNAGQQLGHYRILEPLGAGGMGEVYLAEDVRLGRKLAVKVLGPRMTADPQRLQRFEQEARTISALNHPNILTMYDVGQEGSVRFIATEYVDGITLRARLATGPLEPRDAIDVGAQIASALAAAHTAGVIHRDLKPENVMLRPDGYVKVLDFGLAKLSDLELTHEADAPTRLLVETTPGVILGTFSYMSPEQARGLPVDHRSDIFSLGIVLYEMLTGDAPFKGNSAADVLAALVYRQPEPVGRTSPVSPALEELVATALQKEPAQRHATAAIVAAELRAIARDAYPSAQTDRIPGRRSGIGGSDSGRGSSPMVGTPAPVPPRAVARPRRRSKTAIDSLAVLPLVNANQDQELEYLSDGLTESLISNLSPLRKLRVMARSTVFRYKGHDVDPLAVGRELGVRAVLTGRVQHRGDHIIIATELVDVDDGSQLWGTQLTRRAADLVELQDELSREITTALRLRLTDRQEPVRHRRRPLNAEAYELYLKGRFHLNKRTSDALQQALALFDRAIAIDPKYAQAHAGRADCYALMAVGYTSLTVGDAVELARQAAQRALALDEDLADAHASLGFLKFRFDWDWAGAEAEFRRAIDLDPGHVQARHWFALFLASRCRFDEADMQMQRARELDPLSLIVQSGIGRILHFAGRFEEAIAQYKRTLQIDAHFLPARLDMSMTLMATGAFAEARTEIERAAERIGVISVFVLVQGYCAMGEGRMDEARAALVELRARYERGAAGPDEVGAMAYMVGELDEAYARLEEGCEARASILAYLNVEPVAKPMASEPRFRALFDRYGLLLPEGIS